MIKNLFFLGSILIGSFVSAQNIIFQENFNSEQTSSLWTLGDRDGDSQTWEYLNAPSNEVPSFTGDAAFSFSWYLEVFTPDNTLTSPTISLPQDGDLTLKFKVAAGDDEYFQEHYAVYVIHANSEFLGTETPIFEETLDASYYNAAKTVTVDISDYAGQNVQLVFRHYDCTDIFYVAVDDIMIEQSALSTQESNKVAPVIYQQNDLVKISGFKDVQKVKIFDLSGRLLKEVQHSEVNINTLPKGVYIVNFYNQTEVISNRIIKK